MIAISNWIFVKPSLGIIFRNRCWLFSFFGARLRPDDFFDISNNHVTLLLFFKLFQHLEFFVFVQLCGQVVCVYSICPHNIKLLGIEAKACVLLSSSRGRSLSFFDLCLSLRFGSLWPDNGARRFVTSWSFWFGCLQQGY